MNNSEENVVIKRATTPRELDKVYRFRYKVYVEHMDYDFPKEDGPVIIDPFDETAANFYMEKDNEIVGTVRVNICDPDKVDDEFKQAWAIWKFKDQYPRILYTSKLILHPDHRHFAFLTQLCETVDAYSRENGMRLNLAECRRELLPLYKFIGFKEYHEPFYDSILGELIPLLLITDEQ